jgi:hypothetical protein
MTDALSPISKRPITVAAAASVGVQPADVITVDLAEAVFGLTRKAIEGRIHRGQWLAGRQYHRDPMGTIWVDVQGVRKWVIGESK